MSGPETHIARLDEGGMAPELPAGAFAWIDPDEPADGRRVLRALDPEAPDIVLTRDNETMILGTVVFVGEGV